MEWTVQFRRAVTFRELEKEQEQLLKEVKANPKLSFLLVSEPLPTYTGGRSADATSGLLLSTAHIPIERVSRGGQWTYHGPGQVLIYPITSLENLGYRKRAVCRFLCDFRNSVAALLRSLDVEHQLQDRPFGIYIGNKKIASFGINLQRDIVSHGAAFYLTDQSAPFSAIHPCGVKDQKVACLRDFCPNLSWEETAERLVQLVKKGFKT